MSETNIEQTDVAQGKDAFKSVTNLAIATMVAGYLTAHGLVVDGPTLLTLAGAVAGFYGRWNAGGVKSVAGIAVPQPK